MYYASFQEILRSNRLIETVLIKLKFKLIRCILCMNFKILILIEKVSGVVHKWRHEFCHYSIKTLIKKAWRYGKLVKKCFQICAASFIDDPLSDIFRIPYWYYPWVLPGVECCRWSQRLVGFQCEQKQFRSGFPPLRISPLKWRCYYVQPSIIKKTVPK